MNSFEIAGVVVAAGAVILALQIKRRLTSDESLIEQARPDLAQKLLPFVGTPEESRYLDKDLLWSAIGGVAGLLAIHRATAAIGTLAARRARQSPEVHSAAESLFVASMYTRFIVVLALGEAVMCRSIPMMPRVFAGALAKLYCDMAADIEAVESISSYA